MRVLVFIIILLLVVAGLALGQGSSSREEDYVEPNFVLLDEVDNIQIRQYDNFVVAEVLVRGNWQNSTGAAFFPLASYIGGANAASEKIPMTTPVSQQRIDDDIWRVAFFINKNSQDTPAPRDTRVQIQELPARRIAAIRFSGDSSTRNFSLHEEMLREFLAERGEKFTNNAIYAYYNDPFTPPAIRRNEIMFVLTGE